MPTEADVLGALGTVRDPELDESIVELGFVAALDLEGDSVRVRLRLPTYFCAPNFAYLMVADAQEALSALPGVRQVDVALTDHFAADEINLGVAGRQGFAATFDGLADGELDGLRRTFRRKAFIARQDRLARSLLGAGRTRAELADLRLGDLPPTEEVGTYRARRAELGLDVGDDAPLLVDADGRAAGAGGTAGAEHLLVLGRTTRVSIEGNAGFCRGLLNTRYPTAERSTG
jgi:metal-sulfur cluster biosynthetic enzyme